MNDWSNWTCLIALAAIFGVGDMSYINSILKRDETMDEKIAKIKELILDKVTKKVESEDLSVDEYSKIVSLVGQISYDPKSIYSCLSHGFNGGFSSASKTEVAEIEEK